MNDTISMHLSVLWFNQIIKIIFFSDSTAYLEHSTHSAVAVDVGILAFSIQIFTVNHYQIGDSFVDNAVGVACSGSIITIQYIDFSKFTVVTANKRVFNFILDILNIVRNIRLKVFSDTG